MRHDDRRRFLIIRLQHLGDLILTIPVIEALKRAFPDAAIDLLTRERYSPAMISHPSVNRIIPWPENEGFLPALGKIGRLVESVSYTAVIDLQKNPKSLALRFWFRGTPVYSAPKASFRRRWWVLTHRYPTQDLEHVVDRYLLALGPLGIKEFPERIDYPLSAEAVEGAEEFLSLNRLETLPLLGVAPGARQEAKQWPISHYKDLVSLARKQGFGVVIAGGPGEETLMSQIAGNLPEGVAVWDPAYPINRLAAVLQRCRAVVSNDNGIMHLSAAVGTPVVALFGPTVPAFGFFPLGEGHFIIQRDLPCRPCSLHGRKPCRKPRKPCLSDIDPHKVMKAALAAAQGEQS